MPANDSTSILFLPDHKDVLACLIEKRLKNIRRQIVAPAQHEQAAFLAIHPLQNQKRVVPGQVLKLRLDA